VITPLTDIKSAISPEFQGRKSSLRGKPREIILIKNVALFYFILKAMACTNGVQAIFLFI
jgi:hypothetical protein